MRERSQQTQRGSGLRKGPAWHSATVLPDGSNDIRKIRNCVGLNRDRPTVRLVTKTNHAAILAGLLAICLTLQCPNRVDTAPASRSRFYCAWGCFSIL